jgi:hypothetical protein
MQNATLSADICQVTQVDATQAYQPQYCSGLTKTNWSNLGPSLTATDGSMTISDLVGADPQRFYRLALQP